MGPSADAVVAIDKQLAVLKTETGITDDEILHLPFLHWDVAGYSVAYQVGTVNGISLGDGHFGAPALHGPVVDGVDIFKQQAEAELAKVGVTVDWIEDWDLYHRLEGEVHCGSNTARQVSPKAPWWESGL
jgi:protein-arginine deiminase